MCFIIYLYFVHSITNSFIHSILIKHHFCTRYYLYIWENSNEWKAVGNHIRRGHKISILYRWIFSLPWFDLEFSILQWYESNMHLVKTLVQFWIFIFSWASNMWKSGTLCDTWQQQQATTPSQPHVTRVNNQCIYNHSVPKQSFYFFSFSTVFHKLHDIFNTIL